MKAIALTNKGIEDICALEIKELIKTDSVIKKGFLLFEASEKDIIKLIYLGRTITKVILVDDLNKYIKEKTFAVKSSSTKLSKQIADEINQGKVDLKNPEVVIYAIDEQNYGIDLTGEDLSKRDYRIFLGPESLKGNVAYSLLRIAEFDKKKTLLDCFCRSGVIPIEAALYSLEKSVHFFSKDKFLFLNIWPKQEKYLEELDSKTKGNKIEVNCSDSSMNHLNSAKKNAKIAGINKFIKFSRVDLKDIDLKYKDIDCLITIPSGTPEQVLKQAKEVLAKDGKLVLIMKHTKTQRVFGAQKSKAFLAKGEEEFKKTEIFKLKEERVIMQGKEEWKVLVFEK